MGHAFWKESIANRVKVLESNVLNCCLKTTTADLRKKKVLKWVNDISENLAPKFHSKAVAMSITPSANPLALLVMNDPLPAELKFRQNTAGLKPN